MSAPTPLVEVRDLVKEFRAGGALGRARRVQAVSHVNLTINVGETLGLVGESGCGKSTLGRMIVALEQPTAGEIRFDGTTLADLPRAELRRLRRNLQLMFQDPYASLSPRLRIGAIVSEPLRIQRVGSRAERQRRAVELIREVGLPAETADRYAHELSGGQRQRVGLARALALRPRLIVADEPVSALDVSIRSQILNLMKQVGREHGLTYLFISHDLSVVRYVADRIGVMYLGTLMEIGPSQDVYRRPAHPYTRALLDAVPVPDPAVELHREQTVLGGEMPSPLDPPSGCRFRTRCPRAQALCASTPPPMTQFAPGQFAACHFPLVPAG